MLYKNYKCGSYNIHTIKTDKFKTCHMEVIFSKNIEKKDVSTTVMLGEILSEVSKNYPTRKDVMIHLEELYRTTFYSIVTKIGKTFNTIFTLDFIDPKYINEKEYLENVLKFPFEMMENPLVKNNEFDIKIFNIVRDRLIRDLKSINEEPVKKVCRKSLEIMDKDSFSAIFTPGSIEDLKKITPSSLYKAYQKFFEENTCNIFLVGNIDMDEAVNIIKKSFHNRIICNNKLEFYVTNKLVKKEKIVSDDSNFAQTNVAMLFNIDKITKRERDVVFIVFNYILGTGGLTCKLYKNIREDNSLCYAINSLFLKYDNLLLVQSSLEEENVKKACTLVKKSLKDIVKGDFTDEEIDNAKNNLIVSLKMCEDNIYSLVNNYVFHVLDDFPLIDERIKMYESVTKEEIIKLAKKIKINTTYILKGGK